VKGEKQLLDKKNFNCGMSGFMKVLYITDEDDKFGAPKSMIEMIITLRENYGIYPIVVTSKINNINKICDKNNIENYVTFHRKFTYIKSKNKIINFIKYMIRYIRYKYGNFIAPILINRYIDLSKIDLIHTNISVIDVGSIISRKYNIRHVHHIREFGDKDFNLKSYRKNYIRFFNKTTDTFITISNAVKKYWINKGLDIKKTVVVYNGIYLDDISIRDKKAMDKLKIVISGSIQEGKGQLELVKAVSILPKEILSNIKLDIIGSGSEEYENKIIKLIDENGIKDNVKLLGYHDDLRSKLSDYDVGVVCSRSEGFGRVTVEYMASKLCVIVSNTGANSEIVEDGKDGLIYKYGDYKDLASKIEYIYRNMNLITEFGEKARKKILNAFTTEINSRNIYKVYTNEKL